MTGLGPEIRWGILGAGGIAATVSADIAALPGHTLAAVGARSADRAATFAARHGVARSYGSYDELVADPEVDVIYLATTHAQHHEQALLALAAGKPLLIEKAFTLNARQASEVVAEARARRLFCMEAMWLRFHPLIIACAEIAASGRIGSVIGVRADLSKKFEYDPSGRLYDLDAGGGALLDLGVYPATFVSLLLGLPTTVQAMGSLAPTGTDLSVGMQWGYDDGRFAQLYCSAGGASPFGALITGTDGWLKLEPRIHRPTTLTVLDPSGTEVISVDPDPGNGYQREIAEVGRCLRAGLTESETVPLNATVGILAQLDEARRQLGVRYAAD